MEGQRLDRLIVQNGGHSRKQAKELIRKGRVLINGSPAGSGEQKVTFADTVTLDGVRLRNQKHLYLMLNKPSGLLCATRDPKQPTVMELVPQVLRAPGLFPAGRLDKDTEGFVLLTDDGAFAHQILSPKSHVPKTYYARLSGTLDEERVSAAFGQGVELDGGDRCSPARLRVLGAGDAPCVELTIYEGMYHQVKRMFSLFSLEVTYLKRISIGGLPLDENLSAGMVKEILHKDLERIAPAFSRVTMEDSTP